MRRKSEIKNRMSCELLAVSVNESVCRAIVGVFLAPENPTATELADVKCAVSEAVTNAIVHGYGSSGEGTVYLSAEIFHEKSIFIIFSTNLPRSDSSFQSSIAALVRSSSS